MTFEFKTYGSDIQTFNKRKIGEYYLSCLHIQGDPEKVFRIYVESPCGLKLEITPSKGMSLRDCSYQNRQMFWEAPMENLPDPEKVDLMSTVICDGTPVPDLGWIKYFASHVEMLGLWNWGMNKKEENGKRYGLHGNVSNIPVDTITAEPLADRLRITGSFNVYSADDIFPNPGNIPQYRVTKQIDIFSNDPAIFQTDTIQNLTEKTLIPDWGYHVQLRPQKNCKYLIPSKDISERFGAEVPEDYEVWKPAKDEKVREERGYIHEKLNVDNAFCDGSEGVRTLLKYLNSTGIEAIIPHSPYTMGWFSCGGGNGNNFMVPGDLSEKEPKKLLKKNWDGVGPEIGASDVDHKDNIDQEAPNVSLGKNEKISLKLELRFLDKEKTLEIEKDILNYQKS